MVIANQYQLQLISDASPAAVAATVTCGAEREAAVAEALRHATAAHAAGTLSSAEFIRSLELLAQIAGGGATRSGGS